MGSQEAAEKILQILGIDLSRDRHSRRSEVQGGIDLVISKKQEAFEMSDGRRKAILEKSLRWLQQLKGEDIAFQESLRKLWKEFIALSAQPEAVPSAEEQLGWALVAVTRWIGRQLPRGAARSEPRPVFSIEWKDPRGIARWREFDHETLLLRDLVTDRLEVEAQFPAAVAGVFSDFFCVKLRDGQAELPRTHRLPESSRERTLLHLLLREECSGGFGPAMPQAGKVETGVTLAQGVPERDDLGPMLEQELDCIRRAPALAGSFEQAFCEAQRAFSCMPLPPLPPQITSVPAIREAVDLAAVYFKLPLADTRGILRNIALLKMTAFQSEQKPEASLFSDLVKGFDALAEKP